MTEEPRTKPISPTQFHKVESIEKARMDIIKALWSVSDLADHDYAHLEAELFLHLKESGLKKHKIFPKANKGIELLKNAIEAIDQDRVVEI